MLNLSNNYLTGHLPTSLGKLIQLESLDLSQNKCIGNIPLQLTELNFLSSFNVSQNQLLGTIPHGGQFDTFPSSSFEDNFGLSMINGNPVELPPPPLPFATNGGEGSDQFLTLE